MGKQLKRLTSILLAVIMLTTNVMPVLATDSSKAPVTETMQQVESTEQSDEAGQPESSTEQNGEAGQPESSTEQNGEAGQPESSTEQSSEAGQPESSTEQNGEAGQPESSTEQSGEAGQPEEPTVQEAETEESKEDSEKEKENAEKQDEEADSEEDKKSEMIDISASDGAEVKILTETEQITAGETIQFEILLEDGYSLERLELIRDEDGAEILVNVTGENLYTFVMPEGTVSINVQAIISVSTFAEISSNIFNEGGNTLENLMSGVSYSSVLDWLGSHREDDYYLNTPYPEREDGSFITGARGGTDRRNPNGDCGSANGYDDYPGVAMMNCTGFVWHVLYKASGMGYQDAWNGIPAWGGVGGGGWRDYLRGNSVEYKTYYSTSWQDINSLIYDVISDGYTNPGDIIWTWEGTVASDGLPAVSSGNHHIGIYTGDYFNGDNTNEWWQSIGYSPYTGEFLNKNMYGLITPKAPCVAITVIKLGREMPKGSLEIFKSSSNPELTNNNGAYSLAGAEYGVWLAGHGDEDPIAVLVTDENGYAKVDGLPPSNEYWVKEITPPKGFATDTESHHAPVQSNQTTTLRVTDKVQGDPVAILLGKIDAETSKNMPQGSASLADAEFTIKYYSDFYNTDPAQVGAKPVRTWIFKTDEDGFAYFSEEWKVSGDEFYYISNGDVMLPLGTITIQETKAPKGYLLNPEIFIRQITSDGSALEGVNTYNMPTIPETPQKGVIRIQKKSSEADYGSTSLAGAVYEVRDDGNKLVDTLTTDADGNAQSKELPFGTYTVKEKTAPTGFLIDGTTYTVDLTTNDKSSRVFYKTVTSTDVSQRGIIRLQKKSSEADYGSATLAGAVYEVRDDGNKLVDTLTTDKAGKAESKELPWGRYTVKEKSAPSGFLIDGTTYTVDLTTDNKTDRVFYKSVTSTEVAQRGIIRLQKKSSEEDYGTATLKGAVYGVFKDKACTDKVDTLTTDANGAAQSKELPWGTYYVKETKNPVGFLIDPGVYTVDLTTDNKTDRVFYKSATSTEVPQKGIIELQKLDSETGKNKPQGAGTLKGALYDVFLKSAYQTGDNTQAKSYKGTLTTDKDGKAKSKELPLETYYVIERQPSTGYLIDPAIYEVTLESENRTDRVFTKKITSEETIIRGNVEIIKLKEIEDEDEDTFEGLEGVEFTFTSDTTGKVVKKIVTDKNGFATTVDKNNPRGSLVFDTYTVTETKCPEGLKPIEPFKVTIKDEGVTLKGIYKEDKLIVSPVSVVKVDESTGKVVPAADTEFRLLDENKKPITMTTYYPNKVEHKTFKTDENGQFTFPDKLKYGTYYLEELNAPTGYLKGGLLEFKVTEGATWEKPLIVKYADENAMGKVHVLKVDETTQKPIPAGAEFEISAAKDIVTPDGTVRVKKGEVVDTIVTGDDSTAESKPLFLGEYTLKETESVNGYLLNEKTVNFKLTYKDQNTPIVITEVTFGNEPAMGQITIKKLDETTEEVIPAGAEFGIRAAKDIVTPDGTVRAKQGEIVDTLVVKEKGTITSKKLFLGSYEVYETKAPEGYVLNKTVFPVELKYKDQTTPVVMEYVNVKDAPAMGQITVEKLDAQSGKALANAVFDIRAAEDIVTPDGTVRVKKNDVADTVTTGEDGKAASDKLYLGKYIVKEVKQPQGYLLSKEEFAVELKYADQNTPIVAESITVKNTPTEIEILKVDKDTEKPLEGVTFKIWNKAMMLPENETDKETGDDLQDNMGIFTEDDLVDPDAAVISEYKTDAEGKIKLQYLAPGTYCVQEKETIPGYVLNDEIHEIVISEDGMADGKEIGKVTVENEITKIDFSKHDLSSGKEIEGGKYQVLDKDGKVVDEWTGTKEPHRIQGLTVGETYIFKEVLAPHGYLLAKDVEFVIGPTGEVQKVKMYDELAMGSITIRKTDSETGDKISSADFKVTAAEDIVTPDGTVRMKKGDIADYIRTEEGIAKTQPLFLGKYEVRERRSAPGYILREKIYHVELKYKDQETAVVTEELSITNKPNRIEILKVDEDTEKPLAGVTFKIWNKAMESGVDTDMGVAQEAVTDEDGKITLKRLIPGTYCIQETKTIPGYVLNDEIYELTISKDGRVDGKDIGKLTVKNVITKLLGTVAKDKDTGTQEAVPKKNTTFIDTVKFEDLQIGQEYIIKGKLMDKSTGKPLLVDGKELTAEKKFKAEKSNGTVDVKFVFDASGLKGKQLVVFEKVYIGDKEILSHEDINDKEQTIRFPDSKIGTSAKDKDTGTQEAVPKKKTAFIDTVKYENLIVGQEYTVKGVLMDKSTEKPILVDGKEVTAEKKFKAEKSKGTVDVEFVFDASGLKGKRVVVFEKLFADESEVAAHEDIEDKGQTIRFPDSKIGTSAKDKSTGTQEAVPKKKTTFIDTVKYENLIIGQEYMVKGVLMDKSTEKPILVDGKEVTAEKKFKAEKSKGTVDMEFVFDASGLKGKQVVVFEKLFVDEAEVATHEDINDKDQTIRFPDSKISTTAKDKASGTQEAIAKKDVTIIDTVKYENLIVGQEYTVKGVLMDKETEKPLLVDGKEVTAEKTFKPEKPDGTVDVEFTLDASELRNKETVVFEKLLVDETEVAAHEDINDKGQTITFKVGKLTPSLPGNDGGGLIPSLRTGDTAALIPWVVLTLITAGIIIVVMVRVRRKKGSEGKEKEE